MIFDTDILIWLQRGNDKVADLIDNAETREISVITYMELLQCANGKQEHQQIKKFLMDYSFSTIPLSEKYRSPSRNLYRRV